MAGNWKGGDDMPDNPPTNLQTEKATFYLQPDHQVALDELKLKLRKRGVRTDKSELAREAIELLVEQDIETIIGRLKSGGAE